MIAYSGVWLLIALSFNMWALLAVLRSDSRLTTRLLWALPLLLLPGIGFVAWFLIGPRDARG